MGILEIRAERPIRGRGGHTASGVMGTDDALIEELGDAALLVKRW